MINEININKKRLAKARELLLKEGIEPSDYLNGQAEFEHKLARHEAKETTNKVAISRTLPVW